MPRAGKLCRIPDCPHARPCPVEGHELKPWHDSKRKSRTTLSGSRQQKRARYILEKYQTFCHVCGGFGGDEVDHVIPLSQGGADVESNLRPIHSTPCHRDKTQREAAEGRRKRSAYSDPLGG